jgi:hypothetical protein
MLTSRTKISRWRRTIWHVEARPRPEVAGRRSITATILLRRIIAAELRLLRIAWWRKWRLTTILRRRTLTLLWRARSRSIL